MKKIMDDFIRGTTATIRLTISHTVDGVKTTPDISTHTVTLIVKENMSDADSSAVLTLTADVASEGANGIAIFSRGISDATVPLGSYYIATRWKNGTTLDKVKEWGRVTVTQNMFDL